jgi:ADP-ribose pyrophosphatase YjhB (NUDIX family)
MSSIKFVAVGIIHKNGKVLIGKRKSKDEFVEHLQWVFPGTEFKSMEVVEALKIAVKEETNLDIKVKNLLHARKSPEAKIDIVLLYFDCAPLSGKEAAGGDLKELKWVPANAVFDYFTTSVSDVVMRFLKEVEDKNL